MTTPPDRFREWLARHGLDAKRERVVRTFHTREVEELPSNLQNVAVMRNHRLVSFHLTDDPVVTREALASGKRSVDVPADDWRWGRELGPGFYISNVPLFWVGRSRRKWEFLDRLDADQREKLTRWMLERLEQQRATRYITEPEREYAARQVEHVRSGALPPDGLVAFSGQPYNIRFWKPEVLAELGIEPGPVPSVLRVEAEGWFVVLDGLPQENVLRALVEAGFDGALVAASLMSNPEGVIWNPQAIVDLRVDEQETRQVAVSGPPGRKKKPPQEQYEEMRAELEPAPRRYWPTSPGRHVPERPPNETEQEAEKLARRFAQFVIRRMVYREGQLEIALVDPATRAFEQVVVNWVNRLKLAEDVVLRAGLAALNATWLGLMDAPIPARVQEAWGALPLQLVLEGVPASIKDAERESARFRQRFGPWSTNLYDALLASYPHRAAGPSGVVGYEQDYTLHLPDNWDVEMSNLHPALVSMIEQWEDMLHRWVYSTQSLLGQRRPSKRRPYDGPHFRIGGYGLQAVMLLTRRDREEVVRRFTLRFVRDLFRGLPLAGLSSLQLDVGPRPWPF